MQRPLRTRAAAVAIALLAVTACGGSNGTADADRGSEPAEQVDVDQTLVSEPPPVPEPEPEPEPTPDPEPELEPVELGGDGTSVAEAALLVGDAIEWTDGRSTWSLDVYGLTEIESGGSDGGACVALSGTATPTAIRNDEPWTSFGDRPDIELQAGRESVDLAGTRDGCATPAFADGGYLPFDAMFVALGSPYNFVATFRLESGDIDDVEAVVITSENLDDEKSVAYHLPTLADGIAAPLPPTSDYSNLDVLDPDVGTLSIDAAFDPDDLDDHDVLIQGLAAVPADEAGAADRGPGSCLAVVGSMTVTDTEGGFASRTGPNMYLLIGGHRLVPQPGVCDTARIESAGFQDIALARFRTGASVDFVRAVFVPQPLLDGDTLIAINGHTGRNTRLITPTRLDTLPEPLALPDTYTIPPTRGSMTAAPITFSIDDRPDVAEYTMTPIGFVAGDLDDRGTHRCVHFLADVSADGPPAWAFSLNALAGGRVYNTFSPDCGVEQVELAGYRDARDVEFVAGSEFAVYATFSLPLDAVDSIEALVLGNTSDAEPALFDPVVIDTIPPA